MKVHIVALTAAGFLAAACSSSGDSKPPECIHDGDCAAGRQCLQGQCADLECSSDGDCRGGMVCKSGGCEAVAGCAADADCNGWRCQTATGDCVECLENPDCGTGMLCISSYCRERCSVSADCQEPAPRCDTLTGSCVQCLSAGDCDPAELCAAGRCVPRPAGCQSDADCQEPAPRCDTGTGDCVGCLRNAHCASDQSCDPETMTCLAGYIPCSLCDQSSDTCNPGTVCHAFAAGDTGCLRLCEDNHDCTKGFFCGPSPNPGEASCCVPSYDRQAGTCEAIRDLGARCVSSADCGVARLDDALCLGGLGGGNCTITCKGDTDCPFLLICREYADQAGGTIHACGQKI